MLNKLKGRVSMFSVVTVIAAVLILLPLSNVITNIFTKSTTEWVHIRTHLLADYIKNTILLIVLTATLSSIIGFVSAYFVTFYEFKGRKLFSWILMLPLALPSYIAAFTYSDMFSYTGTISRFMRSIGLDKPIDIMSLVGASVIFSLTLYPYVYLMVKSSLKKNSSIYIENAKMLRASKTKIFTKVIIPLSRPAIVAGTLLVVLETLNDFGVVKYFNVRVFSFAIFDAWYRLGSLQSALRLSGILMLIVFGLIVIEKLLRGKRQFNTSVKSSPLEREKLSIKKSILVISVLSIIFTLSFSIPVLEMFFNFLDTYKTTMDIELLYIVINTLSITIFASLVVVVLAVMIANFNRTSKSRLKPLILKITNLGYAIPGAIIAVTVIVFFVDLDHTLRPLYDLLNTDKKLILTTSLSILVFAYTLRFLTIAFNSVEASYDKIGTKYTEASYTLRKSKIKTLLKVDLPLIKDGLISAFIIVFVDVIKELPLTLILRPGNYNTIATQIYTYASDEMIQEASGPSLILIMISAVTIYILTNRKRGGKHVR